MGEYFQEVVQRLNIEELKILGYLYDNNVNATFKAQKRSEISQHTDMSESIINRELDKLASKLFINLTNETKFKKVFISAYGIQALQNSLNEVE